MTPKPKLLKCIFNADISKINYFLTTKVKANCGLSSSEVDSLSEDHFKVVKSDHQKIIFLFHPCLDQNPRLSM